MNLPASVIIARRYARASKDGRFVGVISRFSQAGIMLGVMALIVVISVMDGFEGLLKQRILNSVPHLIIDSSAKPEPQPNLTITEINQYLLTSLSKDTHNQIVQTVPQTQSTAILQLPQNFKGVLVEGLRSKEQLPAGLKTVMVANTWNDLFEQSFGVVISRYMAFEQGLSVGDRVRIIVSGASHYTPLGRLPAQRRFMITGLFETESELDQQLIFTRAQDLNRLLKKQADSVESFRWVLTDPFAAQAVAKQIATLSEEQNLPITVQSWHTSHGKLFDAVKMEKNMMWLMLSLIVAVAAFNIVSALIMMVTQKQGEIAILKTLGMNRYEIAKVFTLQGSYNGLKGALWGALIGSIIALGINQFMLVTGINVLGVPGIGLPVVFSVEKVLFITGFAIVLAFVASIYPAQRAAKLAPADVLRYE